MANGSINTSFPWSQYFNLSQAANNSQTLNISYKTDLTAGTTLDFSSLTGVPTNLNAALKGFNQGVFSYTTPNATTGQQTLYLSNGVTNSTGTFNFTQGTANVVEGATYNTLADGTPDGTNQTGASSPTDNHFIFNLMNNVNNGHFSFSGWGDTIGVNVDTGSQSALGLYGQQNTYTVQDTKGSTLYLSGSSNNDQINLSSQTQGGSWIVLDDAGSNDVAKNSTVQVNMGSTYGGNVLDGSRYLGTNAVQSNLNNTVEITNATAGDLLKLGNQADYTVSVDATTDNTTFANSKTGDTITVDGNVNNLQIQFANQAATDLSAIKTQTIAPTAISASTTSTESSTLFSTPILPLLLLMSSQNSGSSSGLSSLLPLLLLSTSANTSGSSSGGFNLGTVLILSLLSQSNAGAGSSLSSMLPLLLLSSQSGSSNTSSSLNQLLPILMIMMMNNSSTTASNVSGAGTDYAGQPTTMAELEAQLASQQQTSAL